MATLRRLQVLGCDGGYPGPGGAGSGYLVESGDTSIQLDAGPGTFARLQLVADPGGISAVVLSHEHPDHWTDLESFAVWLLQSGSGSPVDVYAPRGLRARSYFSSSDVFKFHEIAPDTVLEIGSLALSFSRTDHGPLTMATRIDDRSGGPSLVYSADTGPGWSVGYLGPGVSLFLCEATYTSALEGTNRHLSARQAGVMAAQAEVGRLIVTHRSPTVSADAVIAEVTASFGRPVEQAAAGGTFVW